MLTPSYDRAMIANTMLQFILGDMESPRDPRLGGSLALPPYHFSIRLCALAFRCWQAIMKSSLTIWFGISSRVAEGQALRRHSNRCSTFPRDVRQVLTPDLDDSR